MAKKEELQRRLKRVQSSLRRKRLDGMIVFHRPNAFYLTAFPASLSFLLITPKSARLLVDGRYIEAAKKAVRHCKVELFTNLAKSLEAWKDEGRIKRVGLEGSIPWSQWTQFSAMLGNAECIEAENLISNLRLVKSRDEIAKIAASARMNDEIYEAALDAVAEGATEMDIRNVIRQEIDRRGAEGEAFDSIVASGEAGSMPHYFPSHNRLKNGDMMLIDMGIQLDAYCSDMTRVVGLGTKKPHARLMRAFEATLEAEEAALDALGPGVKCADLHRLAVDKLKARRFGKFFTHSLGHGVGLEVHEGPRLSLASADVLKPGMIVTIEPGVYLPGIGGVRIEDLAVITRTGHRVLSHAPKAFRTIPL